jgi:hypothetical protein
VVKQGAVAKTQVAALVQSLLDQVKKDAENLQAKDLKIQALILELAHLLSIATSARNMLAATVKPSRLRRFPRPSSTAAWPQWVCWFGC